MRHDRLRKLFDASAAPERWPRRPAGRLRLTAIAVALGLIAPAALAQQPPAASQPPAAQPPAAAPPGNTPQSKPADPKATPKAAEPGQPRGPGAGDPKSAARKAPPPIAVQQPRTPAEREKALSDLYAHLATSADAEAAKQVAASIERLWLNAGSDTVAVLMERATAAHQGKKHDLALKLLDAVVELAPDYAEGWSRRAIVHFGQNNMERAVGDLRRVLALDPNHFRALDALAHILKDIGQKRGALAMVRQLLEVHPFWDGAKQMHDELAREVEGQAL